MNKIALSLAGALAAGAALIGTAEPAKAQFGISVGFGSPFYGGYGYGISVGFGSSYGYPSYGYGYGYPSYGYYGAPRVVTRRVVTTVPAYGYGYGGYGYDDGFYGAPVIRRRVVYSAPVVRTRRVVYSSPFVSTRRVVTRVAAPGYGRVVTRRVYRY